MDAGTLPPELAGNRADIEMGWAIKAYDHAETYFNILRSVDPSLLKLTRIDDELYEAFRRQFPDLKIDVLVEDEIKTEEQKAKWRNFCNEFKEKVEEFNFGTLIRLDANLDYSEKNTILVPRAEFLAIEIARNREGVNSSIRVNFGKTKQNGSEDKNS
ncbi:protein PBDC1-like [Liolophura sinensis]|uniref:protein PBDC1-like n=1 Tax=Liolophura sinensis TaxID=3198878 RepID=UPI0031597D9C